MPHTIELSDELFSKLQSHAVAFIDTPATVIERALTALEEGSENPVENKRVGGPRMFNPSAPPNLTFTKPTSAKIDGRPLPRSKVWWNRILLEVIATAAAQGHSTVDILDLITVNSQPGERSDNGFHYVERAGLSVQAQDANGAWRQIFVLASSLGIDIEVVFSWQDNPNAAMPNTVGTFEICT